MPRYDEVAHRWVQRARGLTDKAQLKNERMPARDDHIFSYGSHFEIARALRTKGELTAFLLNGDTYGPTTSRHQARVREEIDRSGVPSVIIPHRALDAAGVEADSVQLVDVTQDHYVYTDHEAFELPPGATMNWLHRYDRDQEEVSHYELVFQPSNNWWKPGELTRLPGGCFRYNWTSRRHWLGESLIEARVSYVVRRHCKECGDTGRAEGPIEMDWVPQRSRKWSADYEESYLVEWMELRATGSAGPSCPGCRGRGTWSAWRHRQTKFLSGFDANETRRSYFFCELPPNSTATTVEEAYAALKPDVVHLAEQMGREVKRQGDIFAVPLAGVTKRSLRKAGARFERRGALFSTNHVATETAYMPDGNTIVRGTLTHAPHGRRPDHHRVALGDWHLVVKNTVPIAA